MTDRKRSDDQYSEQEARERLEKALRGARRVKADPDKRPGKTDDKKGKDKPDAPKKDRT